MIRTILIAALLVSSFPVSAQSAASFEQANERAEAQASSNDPAIDTYLQAWSAFNNEHRLDERDGCYFKEGGRLTQILEIDASGKVVAHFTNRPGLGADCWRAAYLGVVFPRPPFAPFWAKLVME